VSGRITTTLNGRAAG